MNRPYRNPFWHLTEFRRTLRRGRHGFHLQDDAYAASTPLVDIDMASFVGLFLSREAIRQAGFPDGRLFVYGDDQLYSLQMRRKGLRIAFAPGIRFEHDTKAAQAARGVVLRLLWKVYYMYRNALIAYRVAACPRPAPGSAVTSASTTADGLIRRLTGELPIRPTSTRRCLKRQRHNNGGNPLRKRPIPVQIPPNHL